MMMLVIDKLVMSKLSLFFICWFLKMIRIIKMFMIILIKLVKKVIDNNKKNYFCFNYIVSLVIDVILNNGSEILVYFLIKE